MGWFLGNISNRVRGGYLRFIAQYVEQMPIATGNESDAIEVLVKEILSRVAAAPGADVSDLEAAIDAHVYRLYGLTEAEIGLIEG